MNRGRCAAGLCSLGARRRSSTGFVLTYSEIEACAKRAVDKKTCDVVLGERLQVHACTAIGNTHTDSPEHGHQIIYLCVCVLDQRGEGEVGSIKSLCLRNPLSQIAVCSIQHVPL